MTEESWPECSVCGGQHSEAQIKRYGCPFNLDAPWPHEDCKCLRCSAARSTAQGRRFHALEFRAKSQGVKDCCPVEPKGPVECTHCGLSGHKASYCPDLDRKGRDLKEHGIWELQDRRFVGPTEVPPHAMNAYCGPPESCWLCLDCGEHFTTQREPHCCPRCGRLKKDKCPERIQSDPHLARPKFEHAGSREEAPPGSLPSREPPGGGRSAQPTSGGLCGCGLDSRLSKAIEARPIDLSCWEVAIAAKRLKDSGKKEDHVRRVFAMMIEAVYLSTEDPTP